MKWIPAYDRTMLSPTLNGRPVILLMRDGSVVWGEFEEETKSVNGHKLDDAVYITEVYGG